MAGDTEVELLVLGSGGGSATRFSTSFAVAGPDGLVLVDCGAPASTLLPRHGYELARLRAVLLSHFHVDHVADLPQLVQVIWLANRHRDTPVRVPVYGPPGTVARLQWLERFHLMRLPGSYAAPELAPALPTDAAPGVRYVLGPATTVEFFATTHFAGPADQPTYLDANFGHPLTAYGMRLTCAGRTLVYSGDSGSVEDAAPHLEDCTLLIHEIGHHRPSDVCAVAAAHRVPRLLLTHVPARYDAPGGDLARELAAGGYDGELTVAADGLRLAL
jgi:ribonuclease BN (tRNA processing enzyme)